MYEFIDCIPKGKDSAITTENLVIMGGFKDRRDMQKTIEAARNSGFVIASKCDDGGGYYIPQTVSELKSFIVTLDNRARHTLRSLQSAKQMLDDMESKK